MLEDNQIEAIAELFDDSEETIELSYLSKQLLDEYGYTKPNRLIRDALLDGLLYVDTIEDDDSVMLALTDWGESVWDSLQEDDEDEDN